MEPFPIQPPNDDSSAITRAGDFVNVRLPAKNKDLADFLINLLGRPQSIHKSYPDPFEIVLDDVISIHHAIQQRLQEQNEGAIIEFRCEIIYADLSKQVLNSIIDLQRHNEVRRVHTVQVSLDWSIIAKFRDRDYPEKQSISIVFNKGDFWRRNERDLTQIDKLSDGLGYLSKRGMKFDFGIDLEVNYTARTWGNDLFNLLENLLNKFIADHRSGIEKYLYA